MRIVFMSLILVLLLATSILPSGLNDPNQPKFLQGLGFAAGHYTGVGMSYKLVYNSKYAAQITFGYYSDNSDDWGDRWAMPGFELQYHLSRSKWTSFYISTGISYEYYRSEYWHYVYEEDIDEYSYEEQYDIDKIWTTGIGFGFELLAFDRISFTIESILYYRDNEQASIMVQGGLHYYFNMFDDDSEPESVEAP